MPIFESVLEISSIEGSLGFRSVGIWKKSITPPLWYLQSSLIDYLLLKMCFKVLSCTQQMRKLAAGYPYYFSII